jgi:hypothetical protein
MLNEEGLKSGGIPPDLMHQAGKLAYEAEKPKVTAEPGTSGYFEQKAQEADFKKAHPWGSMVSEHPGIMGKILHGLATAGNIAGDIVAPATMANIPGTQMNTRIQSAGNMKQLAAANATEAKANPAIKIGTTNDEQTMNDLLHGNNGGPRLDPQGVPYTSMSANQAIAQGHQDVKPEDQGKTPVGDAGVTQHGQQLKTLEQGMTPEQATAFDAAYGVQPTDSNAIATKRLEDGKASAQLSGAERDRKIARDTAASNLTGQREIAAATRATAEGHKNKAEDVAARKEVAKIYGDSQTSAERTNIMTKNFTDALPASDPRHTGAGNDQQAMLSLLANHLGMTMGLQKGARLTQTIIDEAAKSQPWLSRMGAKYDKDGYLSGLTLGPDQMASMVHLARERYKEDTVKARNTAKYAGAEDDGPERTPSESTMHYYLNQYGNDKAKAMAAAKEDGWTVK